MTNDEFFETICNMVQENLNEGYEYMLIPSDAGFHIKVIDENTVELSYKGLKKTITKQD